MRNLLLFIFCAAVQVAVAQNILRGTVIDQDNQPIFGASVIWQNTSFGTSTNEQGDFELPLNSSTNQLVVSFVGYKTEVLPVESNFIRVKLLLDGNLDEIVVSTARRGLVKSQKPTANTVVMSSAELLKAACCNLSESFETNPSIDVNFSDAVSGSKQIKMLGLTSPYILIAEENIPSVRGASQAYGLSFTPGTWVESIQVTKGAGSVINGYESISGQINTELIKPSNDIPYYLNMYGSSDSRFELNSHINEKLSDHLATTFFIHGNMRLGKFDMNHDGFLDSPVGSQINVLNRWQYQNLEKGIISFFNVRYMDDKKQGGQMDFNPTTDKGTTKFWGSEINTQKVDVSGKLGYVFPDLPFQSIGLQLAYNYHNQNSYFGLNTYDIKQNALYGNLIFNSIINNTMNKFSTGINFTYDNYNEYLFQNQLTDWSRTDNSVGTFFEYTYDNLDNFSLILGGRIDFSNRLGVFATPRIHARYVPWQDAVIRASFGRGKRAANIFAENQNLFASSRRFIVAQDGGKVYGLSPEIAWNYGISFNQKFTLFGKRADAGFDFYRTDFTKQAVVDVDFSPQQVVFHNLNGSSYANSLQVDFNLELAKHLNLRTTYKYYDIETQYYTGKLERPLQAKNRVFVNLEYQTHDQGKGYWKFDATYNWLDKQRLPNTKTNPVTEQFKPYSNPFSSVNAQVTKVFSDQFEVYVGGENITNYKQPRPILGNTDPFGPYFDASMIYGPLFGQMYYAGFRFKFQ